MLITKECGKQKRRPSKDALLYLSESEGLD